MTSRKNLGNKRIINLTCCTPASREVQNYLTTIAGTVKKKKKTGGKKEKVHVQRRVQWPFMSEVFK